QAHFAAPKISLFVETIRGESKRRLVTAFFLIEQNLAAEIRGVQKIDCSTLKPVMRDKLRFIFHGSS
ncbi:MAG: hypothetical protein ABIG63_13890, partial [Chloroflexota bacterium]